jgi:hypothetical protein
MAKAPIGLPVDSPSSTPDERETLLKRIIALETAAENATLTAEADHRQLIISEIRQRIRMRYTAVTISVLVIIGMALAVAHLLHRLFVGPIVLVPQSVVIAMFVGPVLSVSAITITLMVGAFRRFKDDDMDNINVASLAVEAAKSGLGSR